VVLVAVVTVAAVGVVVLQGLLYLLPQHGLSRWQPATTDIYSLLFCNSTYFLQHCFWNCGTCTTAGTPRIVYWYVTLIKYRGIRKNSSLKRQHSTGYIYLLKLSAAGIITQLIPAVSQRFQFHLSYFNTNDIAITLKLLKLTHW